MKHSWSTIRLYSIKVWEFLSIENDDMVTLKHSAKLLTLITFLNVCLNLIIPKTTTISAAGTILNYE